MLHNFRIWSDASCLFCCVAYIQVIRMALTGDKGIRTEDHIRLKVTDGREYCAKEILLGIETTVGKTGEMYVADTEELSRAESLLRPTVSQLIRS